MFNNNDLFDWKNGVGMRKNNQYYVIKQYFVLYSYLKKSLVG